MNYQTFLNICTEQQLMIFIEHNVVVLMEEDKAPEDGVQERQQELKNAIAHTTRFGVNQPLVNNKATEEFWKWHKKMQPWFMDLSAKEYIELLREMPWNTE